MATEAGTGQLIVGGVKFVAPGLVNEAVDKVVLHDFFRKVTNDNVDAITSDPITTNPQTGVTVFKTDAGNFVTFNEDYSGAKKLVLSADSTSTILNDTGVKKVIGSDANDNLAIIDAGRHTVNTGAGNDSVNLAGTGKVKVNTGDGNDSVVIGGNANNVVKTGAGDDTIKVVGAGDNVVNVGAKNAGADTIIFDASASGKLVIKNFSAGDVLKIADRNGDGTTGKDGLGFTVQGGANKTVLIMENGDKIVLQGIGKDEFNAKFKADEDNHEGIFTL